MRDRDLDDEPREQAVPAGGAGEHVECDRSSRRWLRGLERDRFVDQQVIRGERDEPRRIDTATIAQLDVARTAGGCHVDSAVDRRDAHVERRAGERHANPDRGGKLGGRERRIGRVHDDRTVGCCASDEAQHDESGDDPQAHARPLSLRASPKGKNLFFVGRATKELVMRTLLIVIALTAGCSLYTEAQINVVGGADASTSHSQNGSGSNCGNGDCGSGAPSDGGIYEADGGCYNNADAGYYEPDAGYYYPDAGYETDAGWCNCPYGCETGSGGAGSAIICIDVAH